MAGSKIRSIVVNFTAGTERFVEDVEQATAKIKKFGLQSSASMRASDAAIASHGSHTVSSMQASSAAIRTLEGHLGSNVRATERFLTSVLPLGPALQAAFPIVGGLAFLGMMTEIATKVYEFYKSLRDAPEKIQAAFRGLNASARQTNDTLALTNAQLENQIAKLEGRHQNTLKEALMEDRVEADKLGDSLNRAFTNLNKLLAEHQTSRLSMLFGTSNDRDVEELLGGKSGVGGVGLRVSQIVEQGNQNISDITERYNRRTPADQAKLGGQDKAELEVARARAVAAAQRELQAALDEVNKKIREREALVEKNKGHAVGDLLGKSGSIMQDITNPAGWGNPAEGLRMVQDETIALEKLKRSRIEIQEAQRSVPLTLQNADLKNTLKTAEANRIAETQERPLDKMLADLNAKVTEAKVRLKAAGLDETSKAIAKAEAEAIAAIAHVNDALARQAGGKRRLLNADPHQSDTGREVLRLATAEQALNLEAALRDKVREVIDATKDQITTQEMLNAAIGKGWEEQRKVSIEVELMKKFGPAKYETAAKNPMSDEFAAVSEARPQVAAAIDSAHTAQAGERAQKLQNEIELQRVLAQAQSLGVYAVEKAALAEQLRQQKASAAGLTVQEEQAAWLKFYAERANKMSAEVAKIDDEIAAEQRLKEAHGEGAEAVRKASLENKYAAMQKAGGPDAEQAIARERVKDELAFQSQLTDEALKTGLAHQDAVQKIERQLQALEEVNVTEQNALAIEMARGDLETQRLAQLAQEALAIGGMRNGMRAFFLDMQKDAANAADQMARVIYDSLNSAVDRISGQLSKMLTEKAPKGGWGAEWGKELKALGGGVVQSSLKTVMQIGLGKLGSRVDGSSSDKALWVRWGALHGPGVGGTGQAPASDASGPIPRVIEAVKHFFGKPMRLNAGRVEPAEESPANRMDMSPIAQTAAPVMQGNGGLLGTGQVPTGKPEPSNAPPPTLSRIPTTDWIKEADGSFSHPFYVRLVDAMPHMFGSRSAADRAEENSAPGALRGGQIPTGDGGAGKQVSAQGGVLGMILKTLKSGAQSSEGSGAISGGGSGSLDMGSWDLMAGGGADTASSVSDAADAFEWGGFMAQGGTTSPAHAYIVGEEGPEILAGFSGRVLSHTTATRTFGGGGGGQTINHIDARGADLGAYNRIARGMEMSSRSSAAAGVQATHERTKRVPKR